MACLRYLIALAIIFAAWTPFQASAQAAQCQSAAQCDQGQAYSACMSELATYIAARTAAGEKLRNPTCPAASPTSYSSRFELQLNSGAWQGGLYRNYYFSSTCAARVQGDAGMINGTLYSGGVCDKGCKVVPNLDPGTDFTLRESSNPNAISIRSGTWKPTGEVCGPDAPPTPPKKDEYCHTTSSGHTVCKSKDKTCVTTASGFRTCASDTANKTGHSATNNSRTEGVGIGAPDTPPNPPANRPGEDWQQSGGGSSTTNNNTGSTTNQNTYNNAGSPNGNQPVPGDGSGPGIGGSNGGAGGDGSGNGGDGGDGEGNTASGGGDCKTPPVVTGDAALGMVARQAWETRCAVESSGSGAITGDINNCDAPFTVEGNGAEAHQLRAKRQEICNGPNWAGPGEGQGNSGDPHEGAENVDGPGRWTWEFDSDVIDSSGFSGGSCPQLGTLEFGRFGAFSMDSFPGWCSLIAALHAVMVMMGAFISMRIVFGDGS